MRHSGPLTPGLCGPREEPRWKGFPAESDQQESWPLKGKSSVQSHDPTGCRGLCLDWPVAVIQGSQTQSVGLAAGGTRDNRSVQSLAMGPIGTKPIWWWQMTAKWTQLPGEGLARSGRVSKLLFPIILKTKALIPFRNCSKKRHGMTISFLDQERNVKEMQDIIGQLWWGAMDREAPQKKTKTREFPR